MALFLILDSSIAQVDQSSQLNQTSYETEMVDKITSHVEYAMSAEMKNYIALMDSLDRKSMKVEGFRIQIFSASGPNARELAFKKQSDFLQLYDKSSSYTLWSYPNWVLRVGDFRTRLEALEFHETIRIKYPASFIIKDEIKVEY
ncbi:MAG: hypothetical protein R2813_08900 [Flavobacteriales bacterium]